MEPQRGHDRGLTSVIEKLETRGSLDEVVRVEIDLL